MSDARRLIAPLALCLVLGACVPKTNHARPATPQIAMPDGYTAPGGSGNSADASWKSFFGDDDLAALVDEALANNQELAMLQQEIGITNAELIARRGEYLPQIGVGAGVGLEKVGEYTSQGASDADDEIEPGRTVPENLGDFRVGFQASWEIDVWKRLRNSAKAAKFRYLSSIEGRNFAVTLLVAEIANSYYELMALDNQLIVVESNIELQRSALEAVKLQKEMARSTELGVQRLDAELLKNKSRIFEIKQEIVETENRINFLCGRYPQPVARQSDRFNDLATTTVGAGIPTQLLENRPDVRAAELELEAAKLDVKAAKALFYPSLSIDADLGLNAFALKRLPTTPESLAYGISGSLLAPLVNRKAIRGNYLAADSRQMKAVIDYERTVLNAYVEVANQLSMIQNLNQSYDLKAQQVERLKQAIETSNGLFRSARADYLEVLTTRRDALESQIELIETKKQQLSAMVNIYQALGGAWREPTGVTP